MDYIVATILSQPTPLQPEPFVINIYERDDDEGGFIGYFARDSRHEYDFNPPMLEGLAPALAVAAEAVAQHHTE